jgi:hypothetical protein
MAQASAEPITRSNWVPEVGELVGSVFPPNEFERPLGDLWTFNCPRGGTVNVLVDTKDGADRGEGGVESNIDPQLRVVDGAGNSLAFADDEVRCSYEPVCGLFCPSVTGVACGRDGRHSIIVKDAGKGEVEGEEAEARPCQGGGGYTLFIEVFRANGSPLSERQVDLGGGPRRNVPKYALDLGLAPTGPALDDEEVPFVQDFR